jgi:protein arginine N-methyltransferase 1
MYKLHDYARMIADGARMGPYVRALEFAVRPGAVVADIGTGTGIVALVACRLGARRVYAIDTNEAIEAGRELARENGVADRIVFIHDDARSVDLPERADVVVSDLRGALPLYGDHLAIVADARNRFLKPGGVLIPERDNLAVAVVECRELYEWALGPSSGPLGITLDAMRARLRNTPLRDRSEAPLAQTHLITNSVRWASLEYRSLEAVPVGGEARLRVSRAGIGHGLVVWFEATLSGGETFSTAPGHENSYGRLFLPWPRPLTLSSGDTVDVQLWAQANGEPWGWNSRVEGTSGVGESFKQSSFLSSTLKPAKPVVPLATLSQSDRS